MPKSVKCSSSRPKPPRKKSITYSQRSVAVSAPSASPIDRLRQLYSRARGHQQAFLERRPHRSLRLTRRRDYVRSLQLPGYFSFTLSVHRLLWAHKRLMIGLLVVYGVLSALLMGGLLSQDTYTQLRDTVTSTSSDTLTGVWGSITQAGLVLMASMSGGNQANEAQQVYAALGGLLMWLTVVWLLRAIMAGKRPKLRDGLYNAAAPLLSTFLVALLLVVQLLPIALAAIAYAAASSSGLLDEGMFAMMFWVVATLLTIMSLYWITSTIMALIVVTLPGMYPMQAIRTAGDLVVGRRVRILLRIVWLALIILLAWAIVMIPVVLLDTLLKEHVAAVSWLPIVPIMLLAMSALTIVWSSSYMYVLYRKVVDDDAAPAL